MTFEVWMAFALISVVNIVTPGPANLNTIRRSAQLGFRATVSTILANAAGLAVSGLACAFGIASFVLASEWLWLIFRWGGIAYLIYLGLRLILVPETLDLSGSARVHVSTKTLLMEGFTLAVSNPKAMLFFMATFPQVISADTPVAPQAIILVATFCAISLVSLTTYAALAGMLRSRFLTPMRYRVFRMVSGFILLGFAGKLVREVR